MRKFFYRVYQFIMKVMAGVLKTPDPIIVEGENSTLKIPGILKEHQVSKVLLVTDKNIIKLGLAAGLLEELEKAQITCHIFDETVPNPTIDNIEDALKRYHENGCQALIAFGGGSPMDCAKGVGARVARPRMRVQQMRGLLKILKPIPLLIAIPTTAGTGSETTLAAVITDSNTHEKYSISDMNLVPKYAVLDPLLTENLPPFITATTGLDALTHAVEAYVGRSNTTRTRKDARDAVLLIFKYLYRAYSNGHDLEARSQMLKAAFLAGAAFTRAYVGYVHALAHPLGGYYQVPHGLANAVLLPLVMDYYGSSAEKPLAELADLLGLNDAGDSQGAKPRKFIAAVRELQASMSIPTKIAGIREEDLPGMIHNALVEANPLYPVPRELFGEDLRKLYDAIR